MEDNIVNFRWMLEQNHTEILPNTFPLDDIYEDDIDNELDKVIEALNLHNRMQVKEFLTIPDEDIVYLIPEDAQFTN
ncbi:hypothetical protein C1646_769652 [Rhizophagus diaphanus]|nr:hypothetical protein C1646_769652 [Rhizophagus diaphanus] [Rhizophagus sp. MUCL 43196]